MKPRDPENEQLIVVSQRDDDDSYATAAHLSRRNNNSHSAEFIYSFHRHDSSRLRGQARNTREGRGRPLVGRTKNTRLHSRERRVSLSLSLVMQARSRSFFIARRKNGLTTLVGHGTRRFRRSSMIFGKVWIMLVARAG